MVGWTRVDHGAFEPANMTSAPPKKRKGMSLDEKRATMLAIFHDTVRALLGGPGRGERTRRVGAGWLGLAGWGWLGLLNVMLRRAPRVRCAAAGPRPGTIPSSSAVCITCGATAMMAWVAAKLVPRATQQR